MKCAKCQKPVNEKANETSITASGITLHLECGLALEKKGEYDGFIKQKSLERLKTKRAAQRFIPGLGYI